MFGIEIGMGLGTFLTFFAILATFWPFYTNFQVKKQSPGPPSIPLASMLSDVSPE